MAFLRGSFCRFFAMCSNFFQGLNEGREVADVTPQPPAREPLFQLQDLMAKIPVDSL